MALTTKHKDFIVSLNEQALAIPQYKTQDKREEDLLMLLANHMHEIGDILNTSEENELNLYCEQYDGFFQCMNLLERLAMAIEDGTIKPSEVCKS
jgi:hypothetical protein